MPWAKIKDKPWKGEIRGDFYEAGVRNPREERNRKGMPGGGGEESLQGDPMRLDLPLISLLCKTIPATINWTWNNIFIAKFSFIFLFNKKKNLFVLGFSIY